MAGSPMPFAGSEEWNSPLSHDSSNSFDLDVDLDDPPLDPSVCDLPLLFDDSVWNSMTNANLVDALNVMTPSTATIKSELVDDDDCDLPPSPIETVTVTVNGDEFFMDGLSTHTDHPSIELHNYSSNYASSYKMKPYAVAKSTNSNSSDNLSPTSSTTSSPNARGKGRGARGKPITELALTEEERRLLTKEGYTDFPSGSTPLTKQEEKVLRKVRRKIRNKRSAQCSRQRKKEYVEELEKKFEKCNAENDCLRREVIKLRKENSNLLVKMKSLVASNGQTSLKTSFFVLILSFLLVLVPYFR